MTVMQRMPGAVPQFDVRNCGPLIDASETWNAVHVGGELSQVWIKTLMKLLKPKGRLIACMNGEMRIFEEGKSTTRAPVISKYCYEGMTPQRRKVRAPSSRGVPSSKSTRGGAYLQRLLF